MLLRQDPLTLHLQHDTMHDKKKTGGGKKKGNNNQTLPTDSPAALVAIVFPFEFPFWIIRVQMPAEKKRSLSPLAVAGKERAGL